MKSTINFLSVCVILAFGIVAGIALRDIFTTEVQAQAVSGQINNTGGYAIMPIVDKNGHPNYGNPTEGALAISPEGDVYVIKVSADTLAKVIQHFNLVDNKSDKKW